MINSMTGFGSASRQVDGISYIVEIRTLNSRYFKANIRLPESLAFFEDDIAKLLRANVYRGTVQFQLHCKSLQGESLYEIDGAALAGLLKKLNEISLPGKGNYNIDLAALLALPGLIQPAQADADKLKQTREVVLAVAGEGIENLKKMRCEEGAALVADLNSNCEQIKEKLSLIRNRTGVVLEEYEQKLKARVDKLLASAKLELDRDTLAREVAIYADRCDIAEELTRLGSHIEQFLLICQKEDNAGRKLDFVAQEMLREANTIASKTGDAEIALNVVGIKSCIDRIKEQVQNVE